MRKFKRFLACLIIVLFSVQIVSCSSGSYKNESKITYDGSKKDVSEETSHCKKMQDGAILHCFCWSFNKIKAHMKEIADAGYTSVQTSPINEVNDTYKQMKLFGGSDDGTKGIWWWHYQPTDWKIGNYQLGTRTEFQEMCKEAKKYGVRVIVDVVPNHTAEDTSKVSKELVEAADGKLYHDTGLTKCQDYSNRLQCTRYSMDGHLPDVDTENKGFQDYFIQYLNDCIACGASGFRYDTAKHIGLLDDDRPDGVNNTFWKRVTTEIDHASDIFSYGEVLQGENERLPSYVKEIGATTASAYGVKIRECIENNNIHRHQLMDYQAGEDVDPEHLVTWVESHDNYINDGTWNELDDAQIMLAWAVIGARKAGAPLFFDRPKNAGGDNKWGDNVIGEAGSELYKDDTIVAVNHFRNEMEGEEEYLYNPDEDSNVLMIERGTKGMVIVNTKENEYKLDAKCELEDGNYISKTRDHSEFQVTNGTITGKVPARSCVVLQNDNEGKE